MLGADPISSRLYQKQRADNVTATRSNRLPLCCRFNESVLIPGLSRRLQHCLRLLAADCWKVIKERFQTVARLKVVEKILDRNARAGEAWRTTHLLWIYLNDLIYVHQTNPRRLDNVI
jgi:hypothetical protein